MTKDAFKAVAYFLTGLIIVVAYIWVRQLIEYQYTIQIIMTPFAAVAIFYAVRPMWKALRKIDD